jgi:hypothetical protein
MKRRRKIFWLLMGVFAGWLPVIAMIVFLAITDDNRPPAPPEDAAVPYPFGAIDLNDFRGDPDADLQDSLEASFNIERAETFDLDGDGVPTYPLLALSGGGSNGAFGAGLLCGWTKTGKRPVFKVVTGVSAGSLQATWAFLGSDYDEQLRSIFVDVSTKDVYRKRLLLAPLLRAGSCDTDPLKRTIDRYLTSEVLDAVAEAHRSGRRLYVGTTNMDTMQFIIWDMGAIAASDRPDRAAYYRDVLLASSAIPALFPPKYMPVEVDGKTYYEMHSDGGTYAQVFFRGFLLDFDDALHSTGMMAKAPRAQLYIIRNGKSGETKPRTTVTPRTLALATRSIENMFSITMESALYRMYVLANRYGVEFRMASIPSNSPNQLDPVDFDQAGMQKLFDEGYRLGIEGGDWRKAPPGLDEDELFVEE